MKEITLAKITRPRLPNVLNRPRLFRLLDHSRKSPVTWVSAPAGSGKTTLISSYLDSRKFPCIWYQVDEGDGDIATFFYYLGLAAKNAAPRYKRALPLFTPEYGLGIPTFTRRFFENLCTRVKPPFFIVFDNYQDVPLDSPFHAVVANGCAAVPEGVRIICLSRSDPLPAYSGLIAGSRMDIIGWDDLRLSPDESRAIVGLHSGDKQNRKTLEWMYDKTQGWAAGLVLLARTTTAKIIDPAKFDAFPPEHIFDYFATELFERTDAKTRDFLVKTSVLPTMNPDIAEQLTGDSNAGLILDGLHRRNYFTYKSRQPVITYQYHPLFREFLQMQMKKFLDQEGITAIKRRAAKLQEDSGRTEDAAELQIESKDWRNLTGLILTHASQLISQGRSATLLAWIAAIPQEMMEKIPYLLFWRAACLMPYQPSESRRYFDLAFAAFKPQNDRVGMLLSWSSASDISLHEGNDFSYLDDQITSLNEMLAQDPSFPSPEIKERIIMSMFNALSLRQPGNVSTNAWDEQAFELAQKGHDKNLRMYTAVCLVVYHIYMGNMAKATRVLEHLRQELRSGDVSPLMRITVYATEAIHDYITAVPESALEAVSKALRLAEETGIHIWDNHLLGHGAGAALSMGNADMTKNFLQRMRANQHVARRFDVLYYRFLAIWHALSIQDIDSALEHGNLVAEIVSPLGFPFGDNYYYLIMAQVYQERGDHKKSAASLDLGKKLAHRIGSKLFECMALLVEAQISFDGTTADPKVDNKLLDHGVTCLQKAFAIAREQNIMNLFGWRSDVMAQLCAKALEHGVEVEYVHVLIRKRGIVPEFPLFHIEHWPWQVKIFTLGNFILVVDGKPVQFPGKVQKKPLEMLKAIVSFGSCDVREEQLLDALWPDAEGDTARVSFKTTLHRLRQLLGKNEIIQVQEGRVSLDRRACWTDVGAFERLLESSEFGVQRSELQGRHAKSEIRNPKTENLQRLEKALQIYRGHFLADDEDKPWAVSLREQLKRKFVQLVNRIGEHAEGTKDWKRAIAAYERGLEVDDLAEEFYQRLMACHFAAGRKADAIKVYNRCRKVLFANLGVEPSRETMLLYAKTGAGKS